ncbi:MAG: glycerophosphodiester phosphodiesterase [Candidatus Wallbacteria bacterium]|nr:glycerophosphodiester phosphodiesterase [Candidatus Wallbacteria bacterium]
MLVLGHRGAPDSRFENTLGSFRAALAMGADGVELDVRKTRDGHWVVHHDPCLPGTATPIERLSLRQVRARLLPSRERVPTLPEVFETLGRQAQLVVELKGRSGAGGLVGELPPAKGRPGLRISSFNHKMLAQLAGTRYPLALTVDRLRPDTLEKASRMGASEIHLKHTLLDKGLVRRAHALKLKVLAWTVDTVTGFANMRALGVDGVITNRVEMALRYFRTDRKKTRGHS